MTTLPSNRFIVAEEPSWSPDGGTIAFTAQEERRRGDVWLVDADGTDLRRLTDTPRRWETTAIFSPEGTSVVYSRGGRDYVDLADLWRSFVAGGPHGCPLVGLTPRPRGPATPRTRTPARPSRTGCRGRRRSGRS